MYLKNFRAVYRYVLAMTRAADDADEIVAETFERAWRSWQIRRPPAGEELPWLLLTARRLVTDRWRRAKRNFRSTLLHVQASRSEYERSEFWLWFNELATALPTRQREVLVLRYERDLTDSDIGRVMGLSPSGVRSLVSRALQSLRAHPELTE